MYNWYVFYIFSIDLMAPGPETLENNLEQDTTKKELNRMRPEISARDDILKEAFVKVDFSNPTSMVTEGLKSIINKIETKFENEDSARATLLKNPQIQTFLALLISEHKQSRELKRSQSNNGENLENSSNDEMVESWEDYVLRESTPENFENFLLSDD
jgi:hypothetical protein